MSADRFNVCLLFAGCTYAHDADFDMVGTEVDKVQHESGVDQQARELTR